MSDERFEGYVKYHIAFEKMMKRSKEIKIIENIEFERESENVKGKKINGGY